MAHHITKPHPPTGKLVIRENKGQAPKYSIVLQYVVGGLTAKTTFGVRIERKQWQEKKQCILSHPQQARLNVMLTNFVTEYNTLILDYFKEKQRITIKELRYILANKKRPGENTTIHEIGMDILNNEKAQGRISASTYRNGVSSLNMFICFVKENYLAKGEIVTLTASLIGEYITWRKTTRRNSNETINKALTPLIKIAERLSLTNKMTSEMYHAIARMYLPLEKKSLTASGMEGDKLDFLTHDDFGRLLDYKEGCKLPRTVDYLDMFCFAVATGLRWSDIVTLEWGHVNLETGMLRKILVKGRRRDIHTTTLSSRAIDILIRWQHTTQRRRFVFGLLDDEANVDDDDFIRDAVQSKGRSMTTVLARVSKEIGLKRLTFHMARHTFAIWALNDGQYNIKQISTMLGHVSILTTETFYARYIPNYNSLRG